VDQHYEIIGIGSSAGGIPALIELLGHLPATFPLPILVVQHLSDGFDSRLPEVLGWRTKLRVKWAEQGEKPRAGTVYIGPSRLQLSMASSEAIQIKAMGDEHNGRPQADPLFASLARFCGSAAVCIVLSGMMEDGARGSAAVLAAGGLAFAQSVRSRLYPEMPSAAVDFGRAQLTGSPSQIAAFLRVLSSPLASV
jgi:two-component system, chemotaxis family, protein-glutamate methylesterase/glutaminase